MRYLLFLYIILCNLYSAPLLATPWLTDKQGKTHSYLFTDQVSSKEVLLKADPVEWYEPGFQQQWLEQKISLKERDQNSDYKLLDIKEKHADGSAVFVAKIAYTSPEQQHGERYYIGMFQERGNKANLFYFNYAMDESILRRILPLITAQMGQFSKGIGPWKIEQNNGFTVYEPTDLKWGEFYKIVAWQPFELGNQSVEDWFKSKVAILKDELTDAEILQRPAKRSHLNTLEYVWYNAKLNQKYRQINKHLSMSGFPLANNRAGLVLIEYTSDAVRARYTDMYATWSDVIGLKHHLAEKKQNQEAEKLKLARWAGPNRGLEISEIEGIHYYLDFDYDGYASYPIHVVYLLLKDGTALKKPTIPPSDFNIKASREYEPGMWYQWKKENGKYAVRKEGSDSWLWLYGYLVKSGATYARQIDANLSYLQAWGTVYGGGTTTKTLTLRKDGRFVTTSSNLFAGGPGHANLPSVTAYSEHAEKGSVSGYGGAGAGGAVAHSTRKIGTNLDRQGVYVIDGYTIEFRYDNGRVRREMLFYTNDNSIYIGGTEYRIK